MFSYLKSPRLRRVLAGGVLLLFALGLTAAPAQSAEGAREGLRLCGNVIIPSLFPFFVLSSLVVELGLSARLGRMLEGVMAPLFHVNGRCAAALVLGLIGGYPVGARTALELYRRGQCSKEEAERLLAFCNNAGPSFILGVVGAGIFGSGRVGALLCLTHAVSALLVGLLFRFSGKDMPRRFSPRPAPPVIRTVRFSDAFLRAVRDSLASTLNICAFVTFFAVVLRLLTAFGVISALSSLLGLFGVEEVWARRLAAGFLELSSGVSSLSGGGMEAVPMAAFMLGWAGFSVHCQVLSLLGDSALSPKRYFLGKLCHSVFAAALTRGIIRLLPLDEAAWAGPGEIQPGISPLFSFSLLCALWAVALLLAAVLWSAKKRCGKKAGHRI